MDNGRVLDVRSGADADKIHVAADDGPEPNARILADLDIADNDGIIGNERGFVNSWLDAVKRFDRHDELGLVEIAPDHHGRIDFHDLER